MNGQNATKRQITVYGAPFGKQRPRHTKSGHTYTPQRTREYEDRIGTLWKRDYGQDCSEDNRRPVRIYVEAFYPIPQSTSKANRQKMLDREIFPTVKPDLDNVIKSIMDGLNGLAYVDDSQVVSVMSYKAYDDAPRVVITVEEVS